MVKRASRLAVLIGILGLSGTAWAADSPQFRGPDRDGVYPATGLAKTWPEGGPKLLWKASGLGEGFASVSVADGRIYTTGQAAGNGSAVALSTDGKLLWKREYGRVADGGGYPGARPTPTYADGLIYLVSSTGNAVALDAKTGELRWEKDLARTYRARVIQWGITESPLVVDDKVIFTPGGTSVTMVALDKKTGDEVWTTTGLRDTSAYCSPRLFTDGRQRQIVTMTQRHMIGVDPDSGALLWSQDYPGRWDIHAVSPVFSGRSIYVSDGYDQGGKLFELAADGKSVTLKWEEPQLDVHHGGVVLVGGKIYGAASNGTWYALDAASGEVTGTLRRVGKGAVVFADGRLYGYTERGDVVMVDPASFEVVSQFEITEGDGQHWAHPVIVDGVLYIRHGDVLMAFDIAAEG